MNRYKNKIPRDDLKRFAKEIAKKLVASDYKAGRVKDPTKIDERQQKKVKEFCKQFFEKAYQKHKKHEIEKAVREKRKKARGMADEAASPAHSPPRSPPGETPVEEDVEDVKMSDHEDDDVEATPGAQTPSERNGMGTLKRKRVEQDDPVGMADDDDQEPTGSPSKRPNLEIETPPPPPPPPAPPVETPPASTPREGEREGEVEMDTDIYADTNFKGKSMADVLAQAQAEDEDEAEGDPKEDVAMENETDPKLENGIGNPMVDDQPIGVNVASESREEGSSGTPR